MPLLQPVRSTPPQVTTTQQKGELTSTSDTTSPQSKDTAKDEFAPMPELGSSTSLTSTAVADLAVPTKIKLARAIADSGDIVWAVGFGVLLVLQGIPVKQQKEDAPLSTAAALHGAAALCAFTASLMGLASACVARTVINRFENPKID